MVLHPGDYRYAPGDVFGQLTPTRASGERLRALAPCECAILSHVHYEQALAAVQEGSLERTTAAVAVMRDYRRNQWRARRAAGVAVANGGQKRSPRLDATLRLIHDADKILPPPRKGEIDFDSYLWWWTATQLVGEEQLATLASHVVLQGQPQSSAAAKAAKEWEKDAGLLAAEQARGQLIESRVRQTKERAQRRKVRFLRLFDERANGLRGSKDYPLPSQPRQSGSSLVGRQSIGPIGSPVAKIEKVTSMPMHNVYHGARVASPVDVQDHYGRDRRPASSSMMREQSTLFMREQSTLQTSANHRQRERRREPASPGWPLSEDWGGFIDSLEYCSRPQSTQERRRLRATEPVMASACWPPRPGSVQTSKQTSDLLTSIYIACAFVCHVKMIYFIV
jgi:hypothetical protein